MLRLKKEVLAGLLLSAGMERERSKSEPWWEELAPARRRRGILGALTMSSVKDNSPPEE